VSPAPVVVGERRPWPAGTSPALVAADGDAIALPVERWRDAPTAAERALLGALPAPVLDIGCGPGRLVADLAGRGVASLGIDPSPRAVSEARGRGAIALCRSVFDPLPGEGRWGSAVLLDGNVGIGGDPHALLARVRALLAPGGVGLVEVESPRHASRRLEVRLHAGGVRGPWFPWARLSAADVRKVAAVAGLATRQVVVSGGRWFALLGRPGGAGRPSPEAAA
jgi:SAM-dependent methyltransferase